MKKIIVFILIIFLVYIIYQANDKKMIDYLVLGDSISMGINSYGNKTNGYSDYIKTYLNDNNLLHGYNDYFCKFGYSIKELNSDINNNKNIIYNDKTYNIKKELREADLVTVAIGMDELINLINKNDISNFNNIKDQLDEISEYMDKMIKNITSLSKSQIIVLGYYNPYNKNDKNINRILAYLNDKYIDICKKYTCSYIDVYGTIKNDKKYLPNKNDYHITSKAYLKIANKIIDENNL